MQRISLILMPVRMTSHIPFTLMVIKTTGLEIKIISEEELTTHESLGFGYAYLQCAVTSVIMDHNAQADWPRMFTL